MHESEFSLSGFALSFVFHLGQVFKRDSICLVQGRKISSIFIFIYEITFFDICLVIPIRLTGMR